jgi:hypothetical protein
LIGAALIVSQSPEALKSLGGLFENRTKESRVSLNSVKPTDARVGKGQLLTFAPNPNGKYGVDCKGTLSKTEPFYVGPAGDNRYSRKGLLMEDAPFCSLIAKVGEGAWHYVGGTSNSFISDAEGLLTITVNDIDLSKNTCPSRKVDDCWNDNKEQVDGGAVTRVTFSNSSK